MNYDNQAFCVSVAGSDSSCGAGVQIDLKTMNACGVWGLTVIAALTAQNPNKFIREQFAALQEEFPIGCYKTGMLMNAETVKTVSDCIPTGSSLVADPVLISTSGFRLMDLEGESAIIEYLLPKASVVTPNIPEAQELCGVAITDERSMEHAAQWFLDMGVQAVIIKGGHAGFRRGTDVYADKNGLRLIEPETVAPFADIHGSGCCYASAIAAHISLGYPVFEAVCEAKKFVTGAIMNSLVCPSGRRVMNADWKLHTSFDKKF